MNVCEVGSTLLYLLGTHDFLYKFWFSLKHYAEREFPHESVSAHVTI